MDFLLCGHVEEVQGGEAVYSVAGVRVSERLGNIDYSGQMDHG